jgi:two-component system sensor histidine kinase BaeS
MLDGDRLETALDCLLENAVNFTTEADAVEVRGRRDGDWVVIEVADSGEGIPADDLPHIFDTFHRGANGDAQTGTGLGLSIVRRIVEARGGTATAASTLGAGAVITLRLPATAAPPPLGRSALPIGRPAMTAIDPW